MKLDAARSRLAIYTEAEGLFSALAHDLELVAEDVRGEASEGGSAEVRVAVASIRVRGVTKRGKLDVGVLSASDRESIERQIRDEILPGAQLVARGSLAPSATAKQTTRATIELETQARSTRITCDVSVTDETTDDGRGKRVRGRAEVSLAALGAPPVKGPMGAFRVKDRVRIELDLVFG